MTRRSLQPCSDFIKEGWASLWHQGGYTACDGLRGLAMIWVCSFHAASKFTFSTGLGKELQDLWWPVCLAMNGDVGVDLFLVLSGFLLGGALYKEYVRNGSIDVWSFYVKRWFRIAPAYIAATLLSMVLNKPSNTREGCMEWGWSNLLFVNNFYPPFQVYAYHLCMVHSWSIAVEFQLYIATPALFGLAQFLSRRIPTMSFASAVFVLSTFVWVICCSVRLEYVLTHWREMRESHVFSEPYVSTVHRMAPYAAGLCGGIAAQEYKDGRWSLGSSALQCAMICFSTVILVSACLLGGEPMYLIQSRGGEWYSHFWRFAMAKMALNRPLIGLAASYLLTLATTGNAPRFQSFFGARCWAPVAALSYSMYLLQYAGWTILLLPIFDNFIKLRLAGKSVAEGVFILYCMPLLALLGTLPLAVLNFLLVERSGMLLGKKVLLFCQRRRPDKTSVLPPLRNDVAKCEEQKPEHLVSSSNDEFATESSGSSEA